jgi:C4-dicarboxylate transporter DctQ subunit
MEAVFNEGEEYEKLPRLLPYAVLPLSMALMLFRFLQAGWALWIGQTDRVVASHEVEDEIQEIREQMREEN